MNNQLTFERGLKLKDFYFTRHAMTDANHEKLLCGGDWDIPLNTEGHRQAAQAASEHGNALASIQSPGLIPQFFSPYSASQVHLIGSIRKPGGGVEFLGIILPKETRKWCDEKQGFLPKNRRHDPGQQSIPSLES